VTTHYAESHSDISTKTLSVKGFARDEILFYEFGYVVVIIFGFED